ncbi:MAG: ABC transporter ATP-binding protein [Coriobacteriia bacterium]|nr:ABC transporter ATP-binding protein [Coriobacteriia bacterium]
MPQALIRSLRFMRAYAGVAVAAVAAVLAGAAADLAGPQLLRWVVDAGIAKGDLSVVWRGAGLLVGLAVAGAIAQFAQSFLSAKASHGAAFDMRNEIFSKLQELSFSYHDRAQTGNLITRVTSDVDLVRDFVGGGLVNAISAALMLVGAVALLLWMNWQLALVAIAAIPATLVVLFLFVGRLGPQSKLFQERLSALNSVLQENIAGIRVVKAFAREHFETGRYRTASEALLQQGLEQRRTVANAFPLMSLAGSLGIVAVTWVGAIQITRGTLTVGGLVAFTAYIALLLQPLFVIGFGAQAIARAGAGAQRLFEVLDAVSEVAERPGAETLPPIRGRVEFQDVSFRYPGDDHDTLARVSFVVEPDTTVAIVGATGSGKSTVVSLVPRFYDVREGAVRIDGHDVRDTTLSSLRSQIGFVMQDSVLFSGTVRENIAYGRASATDAEVRAAAEAAQAAGFIAGLPEGYATRVGERGVKLSGGQRQRIAIARALLVDPRILIMDDSTSSVDTETESSLRAALEGLMAGRTTFVVASRLSTVRRADLILLIEDGALVASGTHDELLAENCLYAEIAASQLAGGETLTVPESCPMPDAGEVPS